MNRKSRLKSAPKMANDSSGLDAAQYLEHFASKYEGNLEKRSGLETSSSLTTEWLTTEEAAQYLKVSVPSLRNMTSSGKIPYYKFERRNRYRTEDLRNLLLRNPRGVSYGNQF